MRGYPEPPAVGDEVETLIGSLERQRATFAYKCGGLTDEQARQTLGGSRVSIGGLLKHLAYMEDLNFTHQMAGDALPDPWVDMDPTDRGERVWRSAAQDDASTVKALWKDAVDRSRGAVADAVRSQGLGHTYEVRPGVSCSLRRLVVDFIEEYARHTGHADLLRESIDGRVGEDPPGNPYLYTLFR